MKDLQIILWRDPLDSNMVHLGYKGVYTTHVAAIHLDYIYDLFDKTIMESIKERPEGVAFEIELTLKIKED